DERGARLAIQSLQQVDDRAAGGRIEVASGLVGEQNARRVYECPRKGYSLLLATGELCRIVVEPVTQPHAFEQRRGALCGMLVPLDRKSTRLNSSHVKISYAVFCLKKKKTITNIGT